MKAVENREEQLTPICIYTPTLFFSIFNCLHLFTTHLRLLFLSLFFVSLQGLPHPQNVRCVLRLISVASSSQHIELLACFHFIACLLPSLSLGHDEKTSYTTWITYSFDYVHIPVSPIWVAAHILETNQIFKGALSLGPDTHIVTLAMFHTALMT